MVARMSSEDFTAAWHEKRQMRRLEGGTLCVDVTHAEPVQCSLTSSVAPCAKRAIAPRLRLSTNNMKEAH